jgi:hypothetical protein
VVKVNFPLLSQIKNFACLIRANVNKTSIKKVCQSFIQGRSKGGGGQVGPAHPRIKVKHIKNKIHLQYLSIICLWFKIWPTPAKNHCYALGFILNIQNYGPNIVF